MKIRSLLLGSAAAVGLATGAYAADPASVMSSLNACDSLGLTGIMIASDDNCVQISGEVKWEGNWGDYAGSTVLSTHAVAGNNTVITPDGAAGTELDWASKLEWNIKVKATADTANGPAVAVIKFKDVQQWVTQNEAYIVPGKTPVGGMAVAGTGGDHTFGIVTDEAYVQIGAGTIWIVGKHGSLINKGDDVPDNFKGLFNSEKVDTGVFWNKAVVTDGGGVIVAVQSDLGNGLFGTISLENLEKTGLKAGTAVGVLEYKGDGITAHITGVAEGFLDGTVEAFAMHAGFTGTFDTVKVTGALAADSSGYYNALVSALMTMDMFTIAVAGEAVSGGQYGAGASVSATVADGVTLTAGGRFFRSTTEDAYQGALQVKAAVTETITLTGEIGVYGNNTTLPATPYGSIEAAYNPGGGFTSSVKVEANTLGAYKGTLKAGKTY